MNTPPPSAPTQCQAILDRLTAAGGEWVPMPELCAVSGSLNAHSRIDELRHKRGVNIANRKERDRASANGRRCLSFYRLVPDSED